MATQRQFIGLAIILSLLGEASLWVIYGLNLFPGHPIITLLWSLTCGVAMGSVLGSLMILLKINRVQAKKAIVYTITISLIVFSICNIICFNLDSHFNYWGSVTNPQTFLMGGFIGAIIGASLYPYGLFTKQGQTLLKKLGL